MKSKESKTIIEPKLSFGQTALESSILLLSLYDAYYVGSDGGGDNFSGSSL